jgi:hypothetical protein
VQGVRSLLFTAEAVAVFPGLISLLLAALPGVELTLAGVLLHSVLFGTLYFGLSYLWAFTTLRSIPSGVGSVNSDVIFVYFVALIATVALIYRFRKISWLRSGRAFHERPGSALMVGLLAFTLTTISSFPAAVILQWFIDHVLRLVDNLAAIFIIYGIWLFALLGIARRSDHLQFKEKIVGGVGWLLSFPLAFYLFMVVQFAARWNF